MAQADGSLLGTGHDAGTAIPAFAGVDDHRMFAFGRRGEENVALTDAGAVVAADALGAVEMKRTAAAGNGRYIRHGGREEETKGRGRIGFRIISGRCFTGLPGCSGTR